MGALVLSAASCSEPDDIITSVQYDRLFSPTDVNARVRNRTAVEVSWSTRNAKVDLYTIELSTDEAFSSIAKSTTAVSSPTTIAGLDGETEYFVRVKASAEGQNESKWSPAAKFTTDTENIFLAMQDDDIQPTTVTLRWTPGETVETIEVLDQAGALVKSQKVSADECAAGIATVTELQGETNYTFQLKRNGKTRGTISAKTSIDVGDAVKVYPGDDLKTILDELEDGKSIALFGGEYTIGTYELAKSVEIFSAKISDKATITGTFKLTGSIETLKITNVNIVSTTSEGSGANLVGVASASAGVKNLVFEGCTIDKPKGSIIYDNSGATWGDIIIENCIFQNIAADGDGFDFRKGNLANLTVTNTTFMNGGRSLSRIATANTVVTFENVTLYNICTVDDGNNRGLFALEKAGQKLVVNNLLIVGVGPQGAAQNAAAGTWAKSDKYKCDQDINNVYYWSCPNLWSGACKDAHSFATELDPGYKGNDPTVTSDDGVYYKVGDPRWIK